MHAFARSLDPARHLWSERPASKCAPFSAADRAVDHAPAGRDRAVRSILAMTSSRLATVVTSVPWRT